MQLPPIHYLRWARSRHFDRHDISLISSGMASPRAGQLGEIDPDSLLASDDGDQCALSCDIAAALLLPPERVWTQPGTHGAILALLAARLAEAPGPVIVEEPAYEALRRIPEFLGAPVLRLARPRARDFEPDWRQLETLAKARPSALLLSQPHNPSGCVLQAPQRQRLVDWAQRHGCALLSDEVYLEFLAEPQAHSLGSSSGEVAVLRSFTKVMGLGGLRVTFVLAPAPWIARAADFSDYGAVALSAPGHALGRLAFARREKLWQRARRRSASGRAVLTEWLEARRGEVAAFLPPAGIICFPRLAPALHAAANRRARAIGMAGPFGFGLDEHPDGSQLWIAALAHEERVHLTPGAFFEDPMAFRLGFGVETSRLREALTRIDRFLRRAKESR